MGEVSPERIWLQWDLDDDPVNEQTWCVDQINEGDAEYVRVDLLAGLIEQAREIERLREALEKLHADKNCTGNCRFGDGKVTALCWRHTVLRAALHTEAPEDRA